MTLPATPRAIVSPSNLHRRRLCPGSARLELMVPVDESAEPEWTKEGKLLHKFFGITSEPIDVTLTLSQREILEAANRLMVNVIADIERNAGIPAGEEFEEEHEKEMVLEAEGRVIFPGTTDYVRFYPRLRYRIIIDAKFGHLDATHAENNWQLAAYSLMADDEEPAAQTFAAIVQPRASFGNRTTVASYTASQMPGIRTEILAIVEATQQPDAPLNPSPDACRYCRAREICPAFRQQTLAISQVNLDSMLALPAEEFGRIGDAIKLAAMLKDKWSEEARRRIEAGELPGWHLKRTGAESDLASITDAYQRFVEKYSLSYEDQHALALDFMGCLSPRWGKLEALFGKLETCGDKKARKILNALFEGLIESKEKAPSPVRDAK